jgi:hypothetical protein
MKRCNPMAHLTPARLVDLAEGIEVERAEPHLVECDACRRALAELRAAMADVAGPAGRADNAVPEPSPLFWDHLSARVRDGVAEEGAPGGTRWVERWLRPRVTFPILAAVVGAVVLAVVASRRPIVVNPIPATPLPVGESARLPSLPPLEPLGAADDPSLGLMADYGTALSWDDMREEMALTSHAGATDEAVITLSAEERLELQRLLEEEMTQPSALGAS